MAKYISFDFMYKDIVCTRVDIYNGVSLLRESNPVA